MPFVSITRLRVRSWIYLPSFFLAAMRIARQARQAAGSLEVKVLRDRRNVFWTATIWESEASMRAFMHARPHGPTMRKLLEWCDEAALVHWNQASGALPVWEEAHRRLLQEGRRSKVNHPSAAHVAHTLPQPVVRQGNELQFK
jgi:hypothetical protein